MAATRSTGATQEDRAREAAVDAALGKLDLAAKARLLGGRNMWALHPLPEIGLASVVMSDGPVGVRGVHSTADDPSVALPSPTALAATWDQDLARRAGALLAQEAQPQGRARPPRADRQPPPLPARRPPFRGVQRGPVPDRGHRYGLRPGRAERRRRHHRQALRGQRRGDRPLHRRQQGRRKGPARAVPRPLRGDRHQRPPLGHHDRVQPGQRRDHDRTPLPRQRGPARRVGLRRLQRLRLDGRPLHHRGHRGRPRRRHAGPEDRLRRAARRRRPRGRGRGGDRRRGRAQRPAPRRPRRRPRRCRAGRRPGPRGHRRRGPGP
ncbi:hypothetical protein SALBM135S_09201 [Streptomyces alboniger]